MRERRRVPRYQFGKTGMLYPAGGGVGAKVAVHLISSQGCAIECAESPSVGKKCELYMDAEDAQIGVEGQVVSKDEKGRTGLKFLSVDKETQKRLRDLCATLRIQSLSAPVPEDVETPMSILETPPAPEPSRAAPLPSKVKPPASSVPSSRRERRRVPRYISELRARLSSPATRVASNVTLNTLSILGGCLDGAGLPEPGQNCEVIADWDGRPLQLPGEVIWKFKDKRAGVRFDSLDAETERLLRQVCANLRLQPLAPLPPEPE